MVPSATYILTGIVVPTGSTHPGGQQDPPRMKHGIRQSRTKANTYVPTYIVGENSPEKNPLSRNSQNFRPDEQHPKHEAAPD